MRSRRETGSKRCKTDPNTRKGGLFGAVGGNCLIFPYAPQHQACHSVRRTAVPSASLRRCTTAPSMPQCQTHRCAKCVTAQMHHSTKRATAPDAPWCQTRHNSGHATPFTTALDKPPRQAGCGGNVIAAAEASAGTAFFLSTKITENTWKSGLRCDKIQIWI